MTEREMRSFRRIDMSLSKDPVRIVCGDDIRSFKAVDYSPFGLSIRVELGDSPPEVGILEFRNAFFSYESRSYRPLKSGHIIIGLKIESIDPAFDDWSPRKAGIGVRCDRIDPFKSRYSAIVALSLSVVVGVSILSWVATDAQLSKYVPMSLKGFARGRQFMSGTSSNHPGTWFTDVFVDGVKGVLLWASFRDLSKHLSEMRDLQISRKIVAAERALFRGDVAQALSEATLAIEMDSSDSDAYMLRGQAKAISGRLNEGMSDLRASLQFDSSLARYRRVSDALRSLEQYEAALQILGEGVKRVPSGRGKELLAEISAVRSEMEGSQRTKDR